MFMCWPSESRQPCSAFSCMAVTTQSPSGLMTMPVWLPFHSSRRGLSLLEATNHRLAPL